MSEVMNIPDSWKIKQLQEVGECKTGLTYSPSDITNEKGLLVLRSSNIQKSKLAFHDNVFVREDIRLNYKVQEGDILICVRNGSKNLIGKNTLITKEVAGVAHGAFMTVFHSKDYRYIFQLFQSDMFFQQVEKNLGATINSINNSDLSLFKFLFPNDIKEQQRIAKILSTLDQAIEASQKIIEKEKNIKKGLMHDLLTNGIDKSGKIRNPQTHEYKESELGLIPVEWEMVSLRDVTKVQQGLQISISDRYARRGENLYPYITIQSLKNKKDFEYILNPKRSVVCTLNDVLMTRTGNTGSVVTGVYGVFHNNFFSVDFNRTKINKDFLVYFLNSEKVQQEIKLRSGITTIPDLNHGDFYSIYFMKMDIMEQKRIVRGLTIQDKKIEIEEKNLEKLKKLKKGLMTDLLSGKVRV